MRNESHMNYLRRKTADEAELWAADRIEELEREVERLKTTPPDKREDLRCVVSDLCRQVSEARAERDALQADNERLREALEGAFKAGAENGGSK